jgi:hypothetical protein
MAAADTAAGIRRRSIVPPIQGKPIEVVFSKKEKRK